MNDCPYSHNNYWLCKDSIAKKNDSWLNSGHPCHYSSQNLLDGSTQCNVDSNVDKKSGLDAQK